MTASYRLSTAIKALCFLAKEFPHPKTSSEISDAIGVNASKLRQILSALCKSEIIASTKGSTGGFFLLQDFTELSLHEIYSALEEKKVIEMDVADASEAKDEDAQKYNSYFNHLFWDIQRQIEERFKEIKLNDIMVENENKNKD